ncbi:hypothetical protein HNP84_010156 [Thermocatellispora tengchongensis]|uniref:Uncharacterized protein n=1 Tax=Thermocatellispora tengchongensis TaxID=1073253 RepID=A0A840PN77_9ACTN|nr:hypothetical protein [Thermocatellispora tengchongensis]MBB5140389.1 hypothetical protein [Thermocatellispora tengchongensis]
MEPEEEARDWRAGLGDVVGEFVSFWLFGLGGYEGEATSRGYGPVKLVVWTVAAIGVAALVSAVRIAVFGEPRTGWAIALFPLILPMVAAVAHRPRRWRGGLGLGVVAGVLVAAGIGIDLGGSLGSFWSGLAAISAGFLACSVVFAAVTWPPARE